ncbi:MULTISPECIES: DNA-3-methyladenine glycosylase I [Chryseobacterium]|uniref:DNA-3-methyladenine glycosylase I n=1 Tax=Chryseobacterium rhizosphaerae TaxID=395937 RepID=A0AAE3Y6Q8_9FLAO|nr:MULTISPECIES: DNA-3-methyladenine glycosylase I [Chryseobacterium]MBL3550374.1 DNA-3-methyladenine glycosylase I [Chryseobacterium sp. KMC2]MDC8100111.1 DNA-3-methyladenine glycosylase I [Chryseobacterium rhizosphaerae]MDR6524940.1 DNA-3-methyladenine glycosylase I [Chryseobacterium rhizosphaerae]
MEKIRCGWCEKDDLYRAYHDQEWGRPVYDDKTIFEFLILESFQAGLSWYTILSKRENFRKAFDHFDYQKMALYSDHKIEELMNDSGIIRNRLKILAAVTNAQKFMEVQKEFGSFSQYIWNFVDGKPIDHQPKTLSDVPATTEISDRISKDLKKRGFKFMGSTVVYAHMQATGMVNDHIESCFIRL